MDSDRKRNKPGMYIFIIFFLQNLQVINYLYESGYLVSFVLLCLAFIIFTCFRWVLFMIMFIFFRFELFLTLKFMFLTFLFGWALFQVISLQFHSMLVKDYNVKNILIWSKRSRAEIKHFIVKQLISFINHNTEDKLDKKIKTKKWNRCTFALILQLETKD